MHQSLTQWILGLQPDYDGFKINPKISKGWKEFSAKRNFRGTVYEITVKNPNGVEHGVKSITIDGIAISGNLIKPHTFSVWLSSLPLRTFCLSGSMPWWEGLVALANSL